MTERKNTFRLEPMNHIDYCTHIRNQEDKDILTRPLFDVNMRLFNNNKEYRNIIINICDYLAFCSSVEKDGYKKPHGWSGANAGIPFNIIAVNRGGFANIMINPKILKSYGKKIESESNCGSLTLENSIKILRDEFIDIEYYTIAGNKKIERKIGRGQGGFTIIHEIQHNMGILITDSINAKN